MAVLRPPPHASDSRPPAMVICREPRDKWMYGTRSIGTCTWRTSRLRPNRTIAVWGGLGRGRPGAWQFPARGALPSPCGAAINTVDVVEPRTARGPEDRGRCSGHASRVDNGSAVHGGYPPRPPGFSPDPPGYRQTPRVFARPPGFSPDPPGFRQPRVFARPGFSPDPPGFRQTPRVFARPPGFSPDRPGYRFG